MVHSPKQTSAFSVSKVLVVSPQLPDFDVDLYIRPIRRGAWFGIGGMILIILGTLTLPYFLIKDYFHTNGFRIFTLVGWIFFVLLNIYYSGILTMFFTSDVVLPFETIKDVMRSYPDWRLGKNQSKNP